MSQLDKVIILAIKAGVSIGDISKTTGIPVASIEAAIRAALRGEK